MRIFPIPFDIQKEDKIIGGKLSIRQLIWLTLPASLLLLLLLVNTDYIHKTESGMRINSISLTIRITIIFIATVIAVFMSYVKLNMQNADAYCWKLLKYWFRKKTYRYGR